jgi:[ribosomal protein S18]-alanine N-acetyltransferase
VSYALEPITADVAAEIGRWRYPTPYDTYDLEPGDVEHMLVPGYGYHVVRDGDELVGYCCFGEDARVPGGAYADDALDVGWGMRPDLMGRGRGHAFVAAILEHARGAYRPCALRLTIAGFNDRSRRVAERAGLTLERERFTSSSGERFIVFVTPPPAEQPP